MNRSLSRRDFLKAAGLTATAATLAACAQPTATPVPPTAKPAATNAPAATAAPTTAPTAVPTKGPFKFSYATEMSFAAPAPGNVVQTAIEKRFNCKIETISIERTNYATLYATRFAAGQIPDIFIYEGGVSFLIDQFVVAELPIPFLKQHMPKYVDSMAKYSEMVFLWGYQRGKNWAIPSTSPANLYPFTEGWRGDMLEKAGVAKVPETLVEWEAALQACVDKKVSPYGFIMRAKDAPANMLGAIYGAFGTFANMWIERDDKSGVDYGMTLPGIKDAWTLLAEWYKKGLIHPEFVTAAWKECVQTWCQGKTAVTDNATSYRLVKGGEMFDCFDAATQAKIKLAYAPVGPKGKQGYFGWGYGNPGLTFGKHMERNTDLMGQILDMSEVISTDPELGYMTRFGREGTDSKRDPVTNMPILNADVDHAKVAPYGYQYFPVTVEFWEKYLWRNDWAEVSKYARKNNVPFLRDLGNLVDSTNAKSWAQLTPTFGKWAVDFITGKQPISKWDEYLADLNKTGGYEVFGPEGNKAYKEMSTRLAALRAAIKA